MSVNLDFIAPKHGASCHFGPLHVNTPIGSNNATTKVYAVNTVAGITTGAFVSSMTAGSDVTYTANVFYIMQGDLVYISFGPISLIGEGAVLEINNMPPGILPTNSEVINNSRISAIVGFVGSDPEAPNNNFYINISPTRSTISSDTGEYREFILGTRYHLFPFTICYDRVYADLEI